MSLLIINQDEVRELLPMEECMGAMGEVLAGLARKECTLPLRQIMWLPEKIGALGLMPSYWEARKIIALKAVTFFPGNEGTELDSHQGAVLLYEARRGELLAAVDATSITSIRTAAVSGVATRLLAREDASKLAIIGSGVQARAHLEAMLLSRSIKRVTVVSKTLEHATDFADELSVTHSIPIIPVDSVREAVAEADVVCTTTSSIEPVLKGEWLKPGTHINAIGSSVAFARELDGRAVQMSRLFVDRRESTLNESGDFLMAKKEGLVDDDHIVAEIGELLTGQAMGRRSSEEITLFKSLGLAVEDLAAAHLTYTRALERKRGVSVDFGGKRIAAH